MKRDMDLVRQILMEIEKASTFTQEIELRIPPYSAEEIYYHVQLLDEAGLIESVKFVDRARIEIYPLRLTWEGHEFLDAARDDTRWNKVKGAMAKAGGFVFEVAKALLIDYMKQQLIAPKP